MFLSGSLFNKGGVLAVFFKHLCPILAKMIMDKNSYLVWNAVMDWQACPDAGMFPVFVPLSLAVGFRWNRTSAGY